MILILLIAIGADFGKKLPFKEYYALPISDYAIGIGCAENLLASRELVKNDTLTTYVNHVANLLVNNSEVYDTPIRVFILDDSSINAYAFPGGILFITKGALKLMENEAELALFLGHEICHTIHRHGMQEIQKRHTMLKAEEAFMELDMESDFDEEFTDTDNELSGMADEIFEEIISPRLEEYEKEADQFGIIYAYKTGYNPREFYTLIYKMNIVQKNTEDYENYNWINLNVNKRIENAESVIERLEINNHFTHKNRFNYYKAIIEKI